MLCGPCYTCARTRYGLKSFILWTVIGVVINVIMWSTATGAAVGTAGAGADGTMTVNGGDSANGGSITYSTASRSTDDVIADLSQELARCQADSVSNESLNTQSLLAQLERDIDNME